MLSNQKKDGRLPAGDMVTSGSALHVVFPQPSDEELAEKLRVRITAGDPSPDSLVRERDVYSVPPWDILGERKEAFCFSPASYHGGTTGRRKREMVVGGGEVRCWHQDKSKVAILGPDRSSVMAHKSTFCYVSKRPPGPATPPSRPYERLGYSMTEIELNDDAGAGKLVLCKVYKSPRTNPGSWTGLSGGLCVAPVSARLKPPPRFIRRRPTRAVLKLAAACTLTGQTPSRRKRRRRSVREIVGSLDEASAVVQVVAEEERSGVAAAAPVVMPLVAMASAERMEEMAQLILDLGLGVRHGIVVLSAMGKMSSNLLLQAGEEALSCGSLMVPVVDQVKLIKESHLRTTIALGLDPSILSDTFSEMEQLLTVKELAPKTQAYLLSFGERLSTTIFCAYLDKLGIKTRQYDALDVGLMTIDKYIERIQRDWDDNQAIPIVSGSLGKSMQLAMEGGILVIVKNFLNPHAPGTMISETRHMSKSVLTCIVSRSNITVLTIESATMPDQSVFVATSFSAFANLGISFDCVAISEGKISLIVVPSNLSSHELVQPELDNVVEELEKFAAVNRLQDRSVISLIGNNRQMSSFVLVKAVNVLRSINVEVQAFSQGSSEAMKVSLVVDNNERENCVRALHSVFFEKGFVSEIQGAGAAVQVPENSPAAAASSGDKRKAVGDHQEAPPGVRQERMDTDPDGRPAETKHLSSPCNDPMAVRSDNVGYPDELLQVIIPVGIEIETIIRDDGVHWTGKVEAVEQQGIAELAEGSMAPRRVLEESTEMNRVAVRPSKLRSRDDVDDGRDLAGGAFEQQALAGVLEGGSALGTFGETREFFLPEAVGGDNGGDPASALEGEGNLDGAGVLPVGGGEQAMPRSATGAVTQGDAGQGFRTDDISSQLPPSGDDFFPLSEWGNEFYALCSGESPPSPDDYMDDFTSFEDFDPLWTL